VRSVDGVALAYSQPKQNYLLTDSIKDLCIDPQAARTSLAGATTPDEAVVFRDHGAVQSYPQLR
jgi:hypothetical protein